MTLGLFGLHINEVMQYTIWLHITVHLLTVPWTVQFILAIMMAMEHVTCLKLLP